MSAKKASQSLPPAGGKANGIIFGQGVYLTENTSQAASVELVRHQRTNYARSRLQAFCPKRTLPFWDSLLQNQQQADGDEDLLVRFLIEQEKQDQEKQQIPGVHVPQVQLRQ